MKCCGPLHERGCRYRAYLLMRSDKHVPVSESRKCGTRGTGRGAHERRTPAPRPRPRRPRDSCGTRRIAPGPRERARRGGLPRWLSVCPPGACPLCLRSPTTLHAHVSKTLAACTNIAVPRPARGRSAVGPPASDSRDISTPTRRQSVSPWPPLHAAPPRRATANCRPNARRRARRAERRLLHLATTHSEQAAPPGRGGRER